MKNINGDQIPVTVISQSGDSTLVEYLRDKRLYRKFVPSPSVNNGYVMENVIDQGIPYGYPWEDLSMTFDAEKLANELHQAGVWTAEDALKFPQKVSAALNATYADNIKQVLEIAQAEKKGVPHGY